MYKDVYRPLVCIHCIGQFIPQQSALIGVANTVRIPPEILINQPIHVTVTSIISMLYLADGPYKESPKFHVKENLLIDDQVLVDGPAAEHVFCANSDIKGGVSLLPVDVSSKSLFIFPHEYHIDLMGRWEAEEKFTCLSSYYFSIDREQARILHVPDPQRVVKKVIGGNRQQGRHGNNGNMRLV